MESYPDLQIDMIGNQSIDTSVAEELPATAHFRYTVWDQIYNQPQAWRRYFGVILHNHRLYRDLGRYLAGNPKYDIVFAPTVVLHHLIGYRKIAKRFSSCKCGQLILLVRNNIATYDEDGKRSFRTTAKFWRWAIHRFKPFLAARTVRFVTDSERLADEYEELTGIRFEVIPHPSLIGLGASNNAAAGPLPLDENRPIRLFLPGPARYEKGADLLVEASQILSKQGLRQPLEFCFQWSDSFTTPQGKRWGSNEIEQLEIQDIRFDLIKRPLTSEEYCHKMQMSDVIVLPYRRESYFARISGVAVEAMLMGKPLLYTRNTWVETIANKFGVGIAMEPNAQSIAASVDAVVKRLPTVTGQSRDASGQVAEFFSPRNFGFALLGLPTS